MQSSRAWHCPLQPLCLTFLPLRLPCEAPWTWHCPCTGLSEVSCICLTRMGANQSKEEQFYKEVQNGNHDAVKSLCRDGASLEWVDKEGKTPLLLACTRGELLNMVITLLNLGANINAYRAGAHGGFPLHHAAKRGLEKTVTLLLSRGANPLALNDDGHTALEMARIRNHVAVVRLLEEKLCLFSETLREISGFGILKSLAPKLVTKKVWGVVVPIIPAVYELAIYESPKVAQPRTRILLATAEIEKPHFTLLDSVVYIIDKATERKYKLYAGAKGDTAQLERFYKASKGISLAQNVAARGNDINPQYTAGHPGGIPEQGNLSQVRSPGRQPVLQSVSAPSSGVSITVNLQHDVSASSYRGWSPSSLNKQQDQRLIKSVYADRKGEQHSSNSWAADGSRSRSEDGFVSEHPIEAPRSAPLLSEMANGNPTDDEAGEICVICCDARAEGACIPCGHLAGCVKCLMELELKSKTWKCPLCREPIERVMKMLGFNLVIV